MEDTMEATFGPDDFEAWWMSGMLRTDKLAQDNQNELYDACMDLAQAERRQMTQTEPELRRAIHGWAEQWNERIAKAEGK